MITNGFTYIAVLIFLAAILVWLQKYTKAKFFDFVPPIVLLYLLTMIFCTLGVWDLAETKPAYSALKNNILFAMIFLMLLRCDIRKILKLGPKMLGGFFAASVSIGIGFIATYALLHTQLGSEAWKALGALCGSWMGGSGNMIAVQAAFDIGEADMAYALVVDSIDYSIWVMFLLWAINLAPKFNKWVKADTSVLDEVSRRLEEDAKANEGPITFVNIILLLGMSLVVSALAQNFGAAANSAMSFLDKSTWTVLFVTLAGLIGAVTPVGKNGRNNRIIQCYALLCSCITCFPCKLLRINRCSSLDCSRIPDSCNSWNYSCNPCKNFQIRHVHLWCCFSC